MNTVRPYSEIPYVTLPEDIYMRMGPVLADIAGRYGPIFRAHYFEKEIVFLVGPEANRFMLVNQRQKFSHYIGWSNIFSVVDMFGRGLLSMDGAEHAHYRKTMNPAFSINYMDRYVPLMNRIIRERAASWIAQKEIDIYEEARKITFDVAAEALTGLRAGPEVDRFRELFMAIMMTPDIATSEEDFHRRLQALHQELYALIKPRIEERRKHPVDDIFGILVQATDMQGNPISEEQLIAHINILLVAGHETSTSLISWLFYLLLQHPDYTQRIQAELAQVLGEKADPSLEDIKKLKVLDNALSEAERLYPPVPNGPRGVVEDFEFNGYHVPAGSFAFYCIVASHLLPNIFANPDQFDPDRFAAPREEHKKHPYALVGFGGGPRICIGINFAQVEIKAMVAHILRNYQLTLSPDQYIAQAYGVTGGPMRGIRLQVQTKEQSLARS